jgi:hypothetical protein
MLYMLSMNIYVCVTQLLLLGDSELAEFLKDEIQMEKQNRKSLGKLPKIKGFEVVETDGSSVVLKKVLDNER